MNNIELIGYAKIAGTKRLANIYVDGTAEIKNYIGEFVSVLRPTILEFYPV